MGSKSRGSRLRPESSWYLLGRSLSVRTKEDSHFSEVGLKREAYSPGASLNLRGVEETVPAASTDRYGFDDLRRFAAALGSACGLAELRALAMASHLLWFDAAGASTLGIETLPVWLETLECGQIDPKAEGRVERQRSAVTVFDGQNGFPPLILERAAELAVEAARETTVGMVRVDHLGPMSSAAAVTAGIALGPTAGLVFGPNRLWSMGLPSEFGLPVVVDSGLATAGVAGRTTGIRATAEPPRPSRRAGSSPAVDLLEVLRIGTEVFMPGDGWLVIAATVGVLEPLTAFHQRVASVSDGLDEAPGRLLPVPWDAHRREARARGIAVAPLAWNSLKEWAQRLAVEAPGPITSQ